MPVKIKEVDGYRVSTPKQVHAKNTTKEKAEAQGRLLRGVEHGWKPTGAPARAVKKIHHSPEMTQIDCSKLHTSKEI